MLIKAPAFQIPLARYRSTSLWQGVIWYGWLQLHHIIYIYIYIHHSYWCLGCALGDLNQHKEQFRLQLTAWGSIPVQRCWAAAVQPLQHGEYKYKVLQTSGVWPHRPVLSACPPQFIANELFPNSSVLRLSVWPQDTLLQGDFFFLIEKRFSESVS